MDEQMNMQAVLDAFSAPLQKLPAAEIDWCRAHWDEAGPALLDRLASYAAAGKPEEQGTNAAMYALFLLAEHRETKALAPLCTCARYREALDLVLGDAIFELLPHLLGPLAGDDVARLQGVIEEPHVDDIVRGSFLSAYLAQALARDTPMEEVRDYLRGLYDTMRPRAESYVWFDWAQAMIFASPETAMPLVEALCRREWIDPTISDFKGFEEDLRKATTERAKTEQEMRAAAQPFDNFVDEIADWYCFQPPEEQAARDKKNAALGESGHEDGDFDEEPGETYVNPWRDVGRNDPCPCGSGRKFKKCCVGKAAPWEATPS